MSSIIRPMRISFRLDILPGTPYTSLTVYMLSI